MIPTRTADIFHISDYLQERHGGNFRRLDNSISHFTGTGYSVSPDALEAFLRGSIFDKTGFCLRENQVMLVNDECSSWCNIVRDFLISIWDKRKKLLYTNGSACKHGPTNQPHSSGVHGQ